MFNYSVFLFLAPKSIVFGPQKYFFWPPKLITDKDICHIFCRVDCGPYVLYFMEELAMGGKLDKERAQKMRTKMLEKFVQLPKLDEGN